MLKRMPVWPSIKRKVNPTQRYFSRAAYIALLSLLVFFGGTHTALAGFGITPPYLRNDRLTRGSVYEQQITLVRSDPDVDLDVEITMNVPGAQEWITIDRGLNFVMESGSTQVPIKLTVDVPANAEFKDYGGSIRIRTVPKGNNQPAGGGVSIALGAQVDVNLKVVDKIYDFEIRRIRLVDLEEGHTKWSLFFPGKIRFFMTVHNTGNTDFGPTKVCFEIYDFQQESLLETTCSTNKIEQIPAFTTKEVVAELPTKLSAGSYVAKFSIYKNDEIALQNTATLSVAAVGAVADYEGYGFNGLSTTDKLKVAAVIGVPLLVLLILIYVIVSRRKGTIPPRQRALSSV